MIKAINEQTSYKTQFTNGKDVSFSDTTPDKGGGGAGFRPHERQGLTTGCTQSPIRRALAELIIIRYSLK